jgi:hypothetical protein
VLGVARSLSEPLILLLSVLPEICCLFSSWLGHAAMRRFLVGLASGGAILEPIDRTDLRWIGEILERFLRSEESPVAVQVVLR